MRLRLLIGAILLVAACGTVGGGAQDITTSTSDATSTSETSPPTTEGQATTTTTTSVAADDQEPELELVEQAIDDLARRLEVDENEIETLRVEAVTWPNGAIGCPQPGEMYTQALVDGHRIVLSHAERVYLYHSGAGQPPFLCESDEKDGGYDFIPPPGFDES